MLLNENLFEDIEPTLEDKFKYLKEYEVYKGNGQYNYTRPCKTSDLNLNQKQLKAFDDFLKHDCLVDFWEINKDLARGIFQVGKTGGHLVLSTKLADPQLVAYNDSFEDFEQDELARNYSYDDEEELNSVIEENHQECANAINDAYNNLIDFDNRVNQLIEVLKNTLDEITSDNNLISESLNDSDLDKAYNGSYYTITGCGGDLQEWKDGYQELLNKEGIGTIKEWITFKGSDMNNKYHLTGDNAYPEDLTFLAFSLDGLDMGKLAMFKLKMEDRWFDDIVNNNAERENKNESLNESQTRFSEINSDLSQEIFNVVLPKKITGDELVDYMYQFNDGLKAGMNKMELLVALKDAKSPDDFGNYIYNNCDPEKYRKIYNESYKVVDEDGNKVAQGGGFKSKEEEAEMFAAQYGKEGLKVVKESFYNEDLFSVEKDRGIRKQQLQGIVDNAIKIFGRIPGGMIDDLDEVGYYVQEQEDGSWVVKDKKDIPVNESIVGESNVIGGEVEYIETYNDCKIYKLASGEFNAAVHHPKLGLRIVFGKSVEEVRQKIDKADEEYRQHFYNLPEALNESDESTPTENGTNQFGDKQYKYKGYTICYFPYDVKYEDKTDHFEAYVIESPAVLSNGYHLPLYCEDENGEVINFLSLEAAKKWIDVFDGKFKIEVKAGNEVHAVINPEEINESFEDEHGVQSISEEQPQVEIPAQDPNNQDNGLVSIINNLIQDEFNTIQSYKDAIVNFANQDKNDLTQVLKDILDEENIHVGQLETLLKSLDSSAENIEQGKQEAEEQIEINKGDNI